MIRRVAADGRIETGGAFSPILRPRVVDRIASAASQRIVLIVAPAGYGKSVAVRQYLETLQGAPRVRYDVQAENGTLLGFVRGLADVLLDIAPAARKTVSGAYEKSRSSKTPGLDLAMWMHAHIKTFTGVVVIDDLHVAENDPEISKFLVSLIERTKGRARWIIASRSSLDLPVGSWLAYGEMDLNIDEQDLRFTIDEAREAARASRVAVRDDELSEILGMTEGWPTALSFALRTSTRSVDLRNIAATTREMVYRYLAEQVYRSLDDSQRELLHLIAYLPEIDLDVIRAAGYEKPKAIVEDLRVRAAFIYPERPGVYRCHDLFRDFLAHQLELEGLPAAQSVVQRAGTALEAAERVASALTVYAQGRASDEILRVLQRSGFQLLEQGHADAVAAALDVLSQDVRATHPMVLAMRGLAESHAGRFDRAESLLGRALARSTDGVFNAELALRLALVEINVGRGVAPLLEPLLSQDLRFGLRAEILSLLAVSYANDDREREARSAIASAEELVEDVEEPAERARILQRVGVAAMRLIMPADRVQRYLAVAATLAMESGTLGLAARAFGALANVALFYDDDMTRSAWYAQQAMNNAVKAGDRLALQTALLQLITVESMRGNPGRLIALERQFADASTSDTTRMALIIPARALMAAWDGRFADAHRLLLSVLDRIVYDSDRAFMSAVCAIVLIADGQRERGLALVASTLALTEGEPQFLHAQRQTELACLLCGVGEAIAGRGTNAARILNRSRGDAPVIEALREAALALGRAMKNRALRDEAFDRVQTLQTLGYGGIAKFMQAVAERHLIDDDAAPPILTKTELAVLQALADGRGPKEIAAGTGRSVYTIQAHIQNVIKKLGCSGRNEALTMARKRGLLA